jgi:hypothetical protein
VATLTATVQPGNVPPRVFLQLTGATGTTVEVGRQDADGRTRPVRGGDPGTLSGGTWVGYDYESWFGQPMVYEAVTSGGTTLSASVQLDVADVWLRHPGAPDLSVIVEIHGEPDETYALNRLVTAPLGRTYPIVTTDGRRKAKTATMVVATWDDDQRNALHNIVADGAPLLLDVPPAKGWGLEHQYMAIADVTAARATPELAEFGGRLWSLPYDEVDRPVGGQQAQWTYADVLARYATYNAVKAAYLTYNDLLANTPSP